MRASQEKVEWVKLFKRESELLIVFQVPIGRKYYPETTGISFEPKNLKHEGWFYYIDKKDLVQEFLAVKEEYERNPSFLEELAEKMEKKGEELIRKTEELTANIRDKSNKELRDVFKEWNDLFTRYMPFIWVVFPVERVLTEVLKAKLKKKYPEASDKEIEEYFNILISLPYKESAAILEQKKILETASLLKEAGKINPEIKEKMEEIYREFSWAGAMRVGWTYLKDPYDLNHYKGLIMALSKGNPDKQLKELTQKAQELKKRYDEFVSKKQIDTDIMRVSDLLRRYIYLRTYRGEVVVKAMVNARALLAEIASRLNLELEDIVYFTPNEIIESLDLQRIPAYQARKKGYKLLILDGEPQVIGGVPPPEIKFEEIRELKGEGIVSGIAKGRVRKILKKSDIKKFIDGEILITQMTSPDMMPAIMKASAIITDEGGLTCHAALISRELQIPCVIATEIATRVLKDGDLVEVNSKEGIVRKI